MGLRRALPNPGLAGIVRVMQRQRRRLMTRFVPLALAALAALAWQYGPVQAVRAIASLSDPARLQTLGERAANPRLNKIIYWLDSVRRRGWSPGFVIDLAQRLNGTDGRRSTLVKDSLRRNLKIADELGLLAPENLKRLRFGQSAVVTRGPYAGEAVEIDHIVPYSLAPEAGNELANLEMLPRPLNRQKSDKVGERQFAHAQKLHDAGLLKKDSLERVRSAATMPRPPASARRR
jgi:5-methylcytosine-specific restriction endonuclease McrA